MSSDIYLWAPQPRFRVGVGRFIPGHIQWALTLYIQRNGRICLWPISLMRRHVGSSASSILVWNVAYRKTLIKDVTNRKTRMILISPCSCPCPIHGSQILSRERRCSWFSANRRWPNNIFILDFLDVWRMVQQNKCLGIDWNIEWYIYWVCFYESSSYLLINIYIYG